MGLESGNGQVTKPWHRVGFQEEILVEWTSGGCKRMEVGQIVAELDAEINRLERVRNLLARRMDYRDTVRRTVEAGKKKTLSAETRERIAATQRKRWAKSKRAEQKAASSTAQVRTATKPTSGASRAKTKTERTMTAAARERIAATQMARWTMVRRSARKTVRKAASSAAK